MTNAMWKLRNAIWATPDYIDDKDKKRFRWLTEGLEQQRTVLMDALGFGHPLRGKAIQCGKINDPDTNYMQRCGIPLCPRCFMTERTKQIKQATRKRFAGVPNEQLAFATILLPMSTTLSDVSETIATEKTRMRNMVSLKRRKDSRWNDFEILGWMEIDRMTYADIEGLGRNSRVALEQLGIPLFWYDDTTMWRPHLHAIIRLDQLSITEVADAFRSNGYGAAYQVDIQPFKANRRVGLNIKSVIQYALKFRIESDFKAANDGRDADEYDLANRKWWPAEDIRAYAEWLCNENSRFQSLRFSLGAKGQRTNTNSNSASNDQCESEPNMQSISYDDFVGADMLDKAFDNRSDQSDYVEFDDDLSDEYSAHGTFIEEKVVVDEESSDNGVGYKNPYTDTNWMLPKRPSSSIFGTDFLLNDAAAFVATSRYSGNVVSLFERLRSIADRNRANGDQRDGTTH